ncbi:MAG: Trm112 family protein [Proteobacteria bacterium]|nr:Trm112 family protein [Pseudomonadota bacterium]
MSQKISDELLQILLCPSCKSELVFDEKNNELICYKSKLAYKINEGIPIMLIDEARKIEE